MSRINSNVPSLISARILGNNQTAMNTALERLSTGLRINKGKDDPAGLIASEMLRGEMKAISSAIDNAHRADNVVSVAEGGLSEVNSLLIDLEGLVDHTSNKAALSDDEVRANQLQIDSILDTLNRIATSTEFQGKKLLNGNLAYRTTGVTANDISHLQITSARVPSGGSRDAVVTVTSAAKLAEVTYNAATPLAANATIQVAGKYGVEQLTFAAGASAGGIASAVNASKQLTGVTAKASAGTIYFNSTEYGSDAFVSVKAVSGTFAVIGGDSDGKAYGKDVQATINGVKAVSKGLNITVNTTSFAADMVLTAAFGADPLNVNANSTFTVKGGGADFSIAPTLGINAMVSLGINDVSSGSLGQGDIGYLASLRTGGDNQMTSDNFETAQRIVRAASRQVSELRGRLGAFSKNTLNSTINSLQVSLENTTSAESAIRDADFAAETSNLTRAQILVQSSTKTLAMANQAPQMVLQLLQ